MRAMILEFIEDRTTHYLDLQYMLGPSLLVAPVFVPESEETEYYLPKGKWTSFFNPQRVLQGPMWVKEKVALDDIPLWVRQDSVLLLGPEKTGKPDYEFNKGLEVRVYELTDEDSVRIHVPRGKGVDLVGEVVVRRQGKEVTVTTSGDTIELSTIVFHHSGMAVRNSEDGETIIVGHGDKEVKFIIESID